MKARTREDRIEADENKRVGDEAARRITEQRMVEEARRDGRRGTERTERTKK